MSSNFAISVKSAGSSLTSDYYEVFDASNTIIGWISRTDAETDDVLTWDVFFASRAYDELGNEFASTKLAHNGGLYSYRISSYFESLWIPTKRFQNWFWFLNFFFEFRHK